jgi:tRNA G18 (ribose-2'-O)-methylase SpoU
MPQRADSRQGLWQDPLATFIPIDSLDDARVAPYRDVRDRDLRRAHGDRFVAEGESVVRVLLGPSRVPPESVLVSRARLAALEPLVAAHDIPVFVAGPTLMEAIVGFPIHRGLLALARRPAPVDPDALLANGPRLVLGLAGIANHDNVGGIFRNAAAFGVGAALVDAATADPFYRKALRVSVGGVLRVPFATVGSAAAMTDALRRAGYRVLALSPRGATTLADVPRSDRMALLLGTEGPGLSDEVLAAAETVRIDMAGGFDSLNVATTSGIALYELSRR